MKLNYKRTFFIGLAFLSICSFWQLYDNIIPLILKNTFHFDDTLTGFIMALDNILALFLLPFFGALSDKTNTRLGKRTPFIVVGTLVAVIFMTLIPIADKAGSLVLFLISLGFVLVAMGLYRSPTVALMPDLTPKPLRSMANAIINLMGAIGGIYALGMIYFLVPKSSSPSYLPVFLAVALIMLAAVAVLLFTIREKKLAAEVAAETGEKNEPENEPGKSKEPMSRPVRLSMGFLLASIFLWFAAYNAVTTAFSRYAGVVWGMKGGSFASCLMVGTVAAIVCYIPIGIISSHFGRKKVIIAGIILMICSYVSGFFFTTYSPLLNVVFGITGIGWAAINVNSYPMVVEMSRGSDIGKYTGLYYTFSMSAQILTPIASGALLQYVSYQTLFPYAAVFALLSLCTMLFVKHGDSKPPKKENNLENFDVSD